MTNKKIIDIDRLRQLEPLTTLSDQRLQELMPLAELEHLDVGMSLFREGDIDNQTIYLLNGDVQLVSSDGKIDTAIAARSPAAQHPLDDSQPRQVSATAITPVEVVRFDNSILEYMMMWDQMAVSEATVTQMPTKQSALETAARPEAGPDPEPEAKSEPKPKPEPNPEAGTKPKPETKPGPDPEPAQVATELSQEGEKRQDDLIDASKVSPAGPASAGNDRSWIRKMNHIMAFKAMPPANLKLLLERMESKPVQQGDKLIKQGENGDYYYVLTEGEARVTRTVELATLKPGSSFGEEALLSGSSRNASVSMLTDGVVMRLSRDDFNELLKEPMLTRLAPDEARLREAGGACWLDVRHAKEYHHSHLSNAINIPLHELRMRMDELNKTTAYICYCGTGRRSSAAAFLLAQNGFEVSVLNGGVRVMAQDLQREE